MLQTCAPHEWFQSEQFAARDASCALKASVLQWLPFAQQTALCSVHFAATRWPFRSFRLSTDQTSTQAAARAAGSQRPTRSIIAAALAAEIYSAIEARPAIVCVRRCLAPSSFLIIPFIRRKDAIMIAPRAPMVTG